MKPFTQILNQINEQLDLPQPVKARVILEIASDLEDAYLFYLEQGVSEDVAAEKVKEKFEFSQESLEELTRIHTTPVRRWIDKAVTQLGTRWEKGLLTLVILFIAGMSGHALLQTPFFHNAGYGVWPVLCIGLLGISLSVRKAYQISIKKDHQIQQLRHGLETLLFLAVSSLVMGIWNYFFELLQAGKLRLFVDYKFIIALRSDYAEEYNLVAKTAEWLIRGSSHMMLSMLVAMLMALIWFALESQISRIEQAEYELLLLE